MKQDTLAIHSEYKKDTQRTMNIPIYMTTAFDFGTTEFAASSFRLEQGTDNVYSRVGNPTNAILERRIAQIEGGSGALALASGMSAIFYSILNIAQAGDNIIASNQLYGGTITLFSQTLKKLGIEARFFDIDKIEDIEKLIDGNSKCIFFETISNPSIDLPDFEKIVKIANKYNLLTIVDNTVATPILCQPLLLGVDIVVHSASKYITGQGTAIGGLIIERNNLAEKIINNDRYKHFNEPEPSYQGLIFSNCGATSILFTFRARMILLRDTGGCLSPFNAWIFIQGLETLSLRIKKHSENAIIIAKWLEEQDIVKKVNYPLLESNKNYNFAKKYLNEFASGLVSFEVENYEKAKSILDNVKIFSIVANIGDSKSIINHSASTTHQQLSNEELKKAGISQGLIRLSIGIENVKDLIDDLKQAFENTLNNKDLEYCI
ncbi:O-acetylhomoserine aminocarboxypropyltransferase/cysteine synthase family protein [Aliarcobacter butzleri]|uniref:O-succinylhomoserine sulfhydrylase n=5 Tax=Aliarcobacter butzleri TaxID=28197 RepID=A0AAW7Q2B4_9BACT|nr:O-acetylhomoserine aminocarboxypropyltransferase/cysteine synthase family protein [Aliarcobacter butzleri]MDN5108079.1 O-acetylhomoserine aminocarboxypropyltransferase/cysteine synthase [Aliarcobacter butzleri]MDN5111103.1 O-acetylhomoserine aminocarboxypropyltransferase/cysteine synthase [Aliarcobacter butzleri]MDN5113058.1 O-acetylhomoserine aminocarboxypropyltransferase/cysteine synthase [Aliarcobacter butzleri]MDS1314382.1 O-acetylhomoserine aminocarboxypropyltransferase/cysteine synthas